MKCRRCKKPLENTPWEFFRLSKHSIAVITCFFLRYHEANVKVSLLTKYSILRPQDGGVLDIGQNYIYVIFILGWWFQSLDNSEMDIQQECTITDIAGTKHHINQQINHNNKSINTWWLPVCNWSKHCNNIYINQDVITDMDYFSSWLI